jgi:hypothetical protein
MTQRALWSTYWSQCAAATRMHPSPPGNPALLFSHMPWQAMRRIGCVDASIFASSCVRSSRCLLPALFSFPPSRFHYSADAEVTAEQKKDVLGVFELLLKLNCDATIRVSFLRHLCSVLVLLAHLTTPNGTILVYWDDRSASQACVRRRCKQCWATSGPSRIGSGAQLLRTPSL